MRYQNVYVLRVANSGEQYAGYITGLSNKLYDELEINREWMEQIAITSELTVICNKEGAVMGLPLNRAVYDADGNLVTVVGGNLFIIRHSSGVVHDISPNDIALIEKHLRAILVISHGFVFTRDISELLEWVEKND